MSKIAKNIAWEGIKGCKSFKDAPVTIDEAIKAIGADYTVSKQSLLRVPEEIIRAITMGQLSSMDLSEYISTDNIIDTHSATYIEDNNHTLSVVGSGYGVVQNSKAFEFIDLMTSGTLGGEQTPMIETAGILDDGARLYVTAKMPNKFFIDGDDDEGIDDYIVFTNTHDGSGAVMALFTPIRVICQNTLNAAIRGAVNKVSFKHTARVGERLEFTKEEIPELIKYMYTNHTRMISLYDVREIAPAVFGSLSNSDDVDWSPAQYPEEDLVQLFLGLRGEIVAAVFDLIYDSRFS
jgi:phage/plasmid-like protein (TIGR03299 family)